MKLILAPPRSNATGAVRLISNLIFADNLDALRMIYSEMEKAHGAEWFLNKKIAHIKNLRVSQVRAAIKPLVTRRAVLLSSETALYAEGDLAYVVVPRLEDVMALNRQQIPEYKYPNEEMADRVINHFAKFANTHRLKIYTDIVPAVTDMMQLVDS